PETRHYEIKGKKVIFQEKRHCIHSHEVKKKQGNHETKCVQSPRARDTYCGATICFRLEQKNMLCSHPLEINIKFTHNHVVNSAESLSFRRVKEEVRNKIMELFKDGYSSATVLYIYEDELHLGVGMAMVTVITGYDRL